MSELKKRFPHYHMCDECAKAMGGTMPEDACCTVIYGICKYCELPIEQMLTPWIDYDWPKDRNADLTAKVGRD